MLFDARKSNESSNDLVYLWCQTIGLITYTLVKLDIVFCFVWIDVSQWVLLA